MATNFDSWMGEIVYVKKNFTYDTNSDVFKPQHFKKGEKYTVLFSVDNRLAITGCMFSLDRNKDKHPSFYEHFYTLKEYRKEKLNSINGKGNISN